MAPLLRQLPRHSLRAPIGRLGQHRTLWAGPNPNHDEYWREQANRIRSGAQPSMLSVLESRGLVKDIAGGRENIDWLFTEKPVGAYVGVDPTAPSLHVGHLLPLMGLFWMYLHGFPAVTLVGTGTVEIGDPSGRTTARSKQSRDAKAMNKEIIRTQLLKLWTNVKALGVKHQYPAEIGRERIVLQNHEWLRKLSAVDLLSTLGSGMRLGSMLARDSVRTRLESGNGMALSEFCYPLFQGYDWWHMYSTRGVQIQLGGSDQYGNICAGMEAIDIMRHNDPSTYNLEDPRMAPYGLTTPLLTTSSGEKFGKSAGNAVWLDPEMMSSFNLYQYFLSTADTDVSRYLNLFTFLPSSHIELALAASREDPSRRIAQHLLAREVVELAHGAEAGKLAQQAHKNAFAGGSNTFYLGFVRSSIADAKKALNTEVASRSEEDAHAKALSEYKKAFATPSSTSTSTSASASSSSSASPESTAINIPLSVLESSTFPQILHFAGLVSSASEGRRLIKSKGAYVLLPNSGTKETPLQLRWDVIPEKGALPRHYLVDFEALVVRTGKSKVRILVVGGDSQGEAQGEGETGSAAA